MGQLLDCEEGVVQETLERQTETFWFKLLLNHTSSLKEATVLFSKKNQKHPLRPYGTSTPTHHARWDQHISVSIGPSATPILGPRPKTNGADPDTTQDPILTENCSSNLEI